MSKKHSKSNVVLIILLAILIIAVLGFGGYLIWKLEFDGKQTVSSNNITTNNNQTQEETQIQESVQEQVQESEPVPEQIQEPIETKEDYMKTCSTYTFKEIARNPNNYVKKRAKFTGEVIQVQQEGNDVILRVNITKNSYGYYEDTILVAYQYADENESRILEEDIITFYGELAGNVSYTSIFDEEITLPSMGAEYIDIKQ